MNIHICPAQERDIAAIAALVDQYVARNIMLARSEESIRRTLSDWLVILDGENLLGCGSLVPLTHQLVEIRSLAVAEGTQGRGLGARLAGSLIELARQNGFHQICALTLSAGFFVKLGFTPIDLWEISPKIWQDCVRCPKFYCCDEIAVIMDLLPLQEHPSAPVPVVYFSPALITSPQSSDLPVTIPLIQRSLEKRSLEKSTSLERPVLLEKPV